MSHRIALLTVFTTLLLATTTALSNTTSADERALSYPDTTRYKIERNGKNIGTHTVTFTHSGSGLQVDVLSKIKVTILKVPVYRFNYSANEIWENGNLVQVNARTDDNGSVSNATLLAQNDGGVQLTNSEGTSNVGALPFSSNHWNAEVVSANTIFNTLTGKLNTVEIANLGAERLRANGMEVAATRYRYSGDFAADVWYDDRDRWVKLEFKNDDGSLISYTADPLDLSK